jgi:hypothetical protein
MVHGVLGSGFAYARFAATRGFAVGALLEMLLGRADLGTAELAELEGPVLLGAPLKLSGSILQVGQSGRLIGGEVPRVQLRQCHVADVRPHGRPVAHRAEFSLLRIPPVDRLIEGEEGLIHGLEAGDAYVRRERLGAVGECVDQHAFGSLSGSHPCTPMRLWSGPEEVCYTASGPSYREARSWKTR